MNMEAVEWEVHRMQQDRSDANIRASATEECRWTARTNIMSKTNDAVWSLVPSRTWTALLKCSEVQ